MASEKKASEGIALLSMYGDEDDEMEELEEVEHIHEGGVPLPASDAVALNDNDGIGDSGNKHMQRQQEERGQFNDYTLPTSTIPQQTLFSPHERLQGQQISSDLNNVQSLKSRLTIVDYGHEEGAMSPVAEEGEIMATGRVMYGEQLQSSDGESREKISPSMARLPTPNTQVATPQSLEPADQPETDSMSYATNDSEAAGT